MLTKLPGRSGRQARWLPIPLAISLLVGFPCADAAEPTPVARYQIEQPSQDMGDALRAISRVTGVPVTFDSRIVAGHTAKAVSGRLSGAEAIAAAVKGTGLESAVSPEGVVVVRRAVQPAGAPSAGGGSAPLRASDAASQSTGVQASAEEEVAGKPASTPASDPGAGEPRVESFTRVEVTGSRLRRVDAEGPAPVNVYTRDDIAKSGQPSLQRFLASLTEVSASSGEGGFSNTLGQGTVQLRGLPLGSTLVLINGRKVQSVGSSSGNVFNLNLIPAAAIERVEVVPQGSSAVYGGDALAGVVNVILRKSINGKSVDVRGGAGRGYSDGSVSLAAGGQDADSQYLLMAAYSRSTPLSMKQREFFLNGDYTRFGSDDARLNYCTPGTVRSISGNLPGLSSNMAVVPQGTTGKPTIADFQSTAGTQNLCNVYTTGAGVALFYGYETASLHALGERKLFGSWSAFTELTYLRDRMSAGDFGLRLGNVTVPAANIYNPFGVDVKVTAALSPDNGTEGLSRQTSFTRALVGAKGELGGGWDAEVTASMSADRGGSQSWNIRSNSTALAAALASTNPATALNPFTTGRVATDAVLRGIWTDSVRRSAGRKDQVTGLVRGTVLDLPAGPVDAIFGAEGSRDSYDVSTSSEIHTRRSSAAVYGEARAPLLRSSSEGAGRWDLAALTLAARRDHYSDFGSANTFQGGLELRPLRSLLIRASAATSFKPPTMLQTHVSEMSYDASLYGLVDPARGGEAITSGTILRTTNPGLQPEHGKSRGIGAVWEPEGGLGSRIGLTYWQLRIRDMIALQGIQAALDNEALFPGLIMRGPSVNGRPGVVTSIKNTEVNFGRLDTSGMDLDMAYVWRAQAGKVTVSGGATHTSKYAVQLAPGGAVVDRLGRRFSDYWSPRWKGRLALGLDQGAWNVGLTSRYLGAYKDIGTSDRGLGNFWLHDLSGTLNLKKLWPGLLPGFKTASLGASIANLANREPQFAEGAPYYDNTQADWHGRYASVRLSLDW